MPVTTPASWRFGRFEVLPARRQLLVDGRPVAIGARAFDLLVALIERADRVVPQDELFELVWPGLVVENNNLQVQVSALRKVVGADTIVTVQGRGYRFAANAQAHDAPASAAMPPTAASNAATTATTIATATATGTATAATAMPSVSSPFDSAAATPAAPSAPATLHLPQPRTRFIGREAALAESARLLDAARLLTLRGIGGSGKTRLALELARRHAAAFADGAWFVDLSVLPDGARVASTVAATLGVPDEPGATLVARLVEHLAPRTLLLVLDNCEHVLDAAAPLVDALLAGCARLKIVATSREALHLAGEQVYAVPSLSLPASAELAAVQASEAAGVFADRARLVLPEFAIDERNAAAIAEICRRLDGVALAIELAAAGLKLLSVEEIRARLDQRFRLLTGGSRSMARHQTLLATMQWSHDHLAPAEQRLFRRLAVFAGGCTLAGAVRVADAADEFEVLELLTALHDQSLLVTERRGDEPPRYRMLETVHAYALERLQASGDEADARTRHLAHAVALAEEASKGLFGPDQGKWIARLRQEQENLLAAQAWCAHAPDGAALALRMAIALPRYWRTSAQSELGYGFIRRSLELAGDAGDALARARAQFALAQIALYIGRYDESVASAERGLALARERGDRPRVAIGLGILGAALQVSGQTARAVHTLEEARDLARELGDRAMLANALNNLAESHRAAGDTSAARRCYEEAIGLARELGDPRGTAMASCNLARVLIASGEHARARRLLRDSQSGALAAGLTGMAEYLLDVGAALAASEGDALAAARLHGAALARMREAGTRREPLDEAFIAPLLARARNAAKAAAFDAAQAEGAAWDYAASMEALQRWLGREA